MAKPVLITNFFQQRKTVDSLIEGSRADEDYFLFFVFAVFITTLGILIDNTIVVVGGMLVAPILFPILALGMGVVTASREAIMRSSKNLAKSVFIALVISSATAFLINGGEVTELMMMTSNVSFIAFIIAFFSGVVAAYSWAKENVSETLPGIAITVSLVPPLSTIGIALTLFSREIFSGAILLFLINIMGIVLGSVIVFSLFGFSSQAKWQAKKIREEAELEAELKNEGAHPGSSDRAE